MTRSKGRWATAAILAVAVFLSACQGAAPAPAPTATKAPSTSPEKAASPAKQAEPTPAPKASEKPGAIPSNLPKSTQEYLVQLKKDASVLAGLDEELRVPQAWMDGAQKEAKLVLLSTIDPPQAVVLLKPFNERYPFIKVEYGRASHEDRAIKTLVAAEAGRATTDIVTGIGGTFFLYKEGDLLADLRDIPNWKNNPEGFKDPGGLWVGMHIRHWAMAYNKNKVKESDLPKTWDDLLINPVWRNGNLALGNRPQLWLLPLWKKNGEQWAKNYATKLMSEVKPQLRKEGMNAMIDLLAAGEFYATLPSAEYRTYQKVVDGGPVSWWSPEPIPLATSELGIIKKAANPNAARIFTNWLLSKEGQLAQYVSDFAPPVHKDMRNPEWLPFANLIIGKPTQLRLPEDEETIQPKLLEFWDQLWLKGGGTAR